MKLSYTLVLFNISNYQLRKIHTEFSNMTIWDDSFPELIKPFSKVKLLIKFSRCYLPFARLSSHGRVDYCVSKTGSSSQDRYITFSIIAFIKDSRPVMNIYWNAVAYLPKLCLFPFSSSSSSSLSSIFLVRNGNAPIALIEHNENYSQHYLAQVGKTSSSCFSLWMYLYRPILKKLHLVPQILCPSKFTDTSSDSKHSQILKHLTIPGTHDSGTSSMRIFLTSPWAKTQNLSIFDQLVRGVRGLDFRIGYQPSHTGNSRFLLVHDVFHTRTSLISALLDVKRFSLLSPEEILILDFHRFVNLRSHTPKLDPQVIKEILSLTKSILQDLLLPGAYTLSTLSDVWKCSQRIIVSFNYAVKDPLIWSPITQLWGGSSIIQKVELRHFIAQTIQAGTPVNSLSSIPAALPGVIPCNSIGLDRPFYVPSLSPELSLWFTADSSWAHTANIISADFIERTGLISNCIVANLLKGSGVQDNDI